MALDLNTQEEYIHIDGQKFPLHREFYGQVVQQTPLLLQSGRKGMSVADVLKRRYAVAEAPQEIRTNWHDNDFFTTLGNHRFRDGSAKLVLNDEYLNELGPETTLRSGAQILNDEQWESLTGKNILHLSPKRVKEIHRKEYTKESILDSPEWNFISEADASALKEVTEYLFDEMQRRFNYKEGMGLYFDDMQETHTNRAAYVDWLVYRSRLVGWRGLGVDDGRLVGSLAPEARSAPGMVLVKPNLETALRIVNEHMQTSGIVLRTK